jgi:hypothetical protein
MTRSIRWRARRAYIATLKSSLMDALVLLAVLAVATWQRTPPASRERP